MYSMCKCFNEKHTDGYYMREENVEGEKQEVDSIFSFLYRKWILFSDNGLCFACFQSRHTCTSVYCI